ncbi:MAG TPA: VOC family protein [Candidatus Methanoperedens sp.]|nr:VOC family protein [Candidatus Methanoperedens sp.]
MVKRLHHIALGARDVERVAAFYRDLLGLPEVARHLAPDGSLRSVWLDLGGPVLMVERTGEPPRPVAGVGVGPFLLALALSPAECEACELTLAAAGVPVESRTEHTRYFRDPEGSRVAVSSYTLRHTE